jgi:hypothetical protein
LLDGEYSIPVSEFDDDILLRRMLTESNEEVASPPRRSIGAQLIETNELGDEDEKLLKSIYLAESDAEGNPEVEEHVFSKTTRRNIAGRQKL